MRLSLDKNLPRSPLNKKEIEHLASMLWKWHGIALIPTGDILEDDGIKWAIEGHATKLYGPRETALMNEGRKRH